MLCVALHRAERPLHGESRPWKRTNTSTVPHLCKQCVEAWAQNINCHADGGTLKENIRTHQAKMSIGSTIGCDCTTSRLETVKPSRRSSNPNIDLPVSNETHIQEETTSPCMPMLPQNHLPTHVAKHPVLVSCMWPANSKRHELR